MADQTPPAAPVDPTSTLAALSPEDRATWRQTGQLPDASPVELPSGDEDAGDDSAEDATASAPAPETPPAAAATPAKPEPKISRRQQEIINLKITTARAEMERDEARAALARLGQPGKPEQAQPPAKPSQLADPSDPEPTFDQFLDQPDPYLAHVRATAAWDRRQEARAQQDTDRQRAERQAQHQRQATWQQRAAALAATTPTYAPTTQPFYDWLQREHQYVGAIADALLDSPVGPQIALHLATHQEDVNRLARLHWRDQIREIGRLEANFTEQPSSASGSPPVLSPKTVTSAPPPPTTLGSRPADPADAEAGAVARRDFCAFRDAANARELRQAGNR